MFKTTHFFGLVGNCLFKLFLIHQIFLNSKIDVGVVQNGENVVLANDIANVGIHPYTASGFLADDEGARHAGARRELAWRPVEGGATQGYLDLGAQIDPSEGALVYLLFTVTADRPRQIALRVGSSDQVCVRVGGSEPIMRLGGVTVNFMPYGSPSGSG